MAEQPSTTGGMQRTLGLTGVTMNAMALIAPGAFLWITIQLQAANTGGDTDMWTGIVVALIIALLTAFSFAELARRYPDAGTGGSYYFAEKAFLDRDEPTHQRFARIAKFVTGWAAHLFYWVYPGVMVSFMAILVTYILGQFGITLPLIGQIMVAIVFCVVVGAIAVRGINGSTNVNIAMNVIQLAALIGFSILAIVFRLTNPLGMSQWAHPSALSVITPHNIGGMLFQSTIAILILVGFESATSLAAEAKNPKRDIPRAVILSLIIQGLFAYLFEYFAANYAIGDKLVSTAADGSTVSGMAAVAASGAPIGDMMKLMGDALLGGNGFALMIILSITVVFAILGTTLAAVNTAVRISFAMAQDKEMPDVMGLLHGQYATPHVGIWILVAVCAVMGSIGVISVTALTGITLASNIGTFVLYAVICGVTFVGFAGRAEFHSVKHAVIPFLGIIGNVGMLLAIVVIGLTTGGVSTQATIMALAIAGLWGAISAAYLVWNSRKQGKAIIAIPSAASGD
jgi:amino acid transporter